MLSLLRVRLKHPLVFVQSFGVVYGYSVALLVAYDEIVLRPSVVFVHEKQGTGEKLAEFSLFGFFVARAATGAALVVDSLDEGVHHLLELALVLSVVLEPLLGDGTRRTGEVVVLVGAGVLARVGQLRDQVLRIHEGVDFFLQLQGFQRLVWGQALALF